MRLNHEDLQELADYLRGTAYSIQEGLDACGIDGFDDDIEEQLLEVDCERCQVCDWWYECCELASDDEDECGICEDCREN